MTVLVQIIMINGFLINKVEFYKHKVHNAWLYYKKYKI